MGKNPLIGSESGGWLRVNKYVAKRWLYNKKDSCFSFSKLSITGAVSVLIAVTVSVLTAVTISVLKAVTVSLLKAVEVSVSTAVAVSVLIV